MTFHLIFTFYATTLIKNSLVNHGDHACFVLISPGFKHQHGQIPSLWLYKAFFCPSRQIPNQCITQIMPQALNYDLQASNLRVYNYFNKMLSINHTIYQAHSQDIFTFRTLRPRLFLGPSSPESDSPPGPCFSRRFRKPPARPLRFFSPSILLNR